MKVFCGLVSSRRWSSLFFYPENSYVKQHGTYGFVPPCGMPWLGTDKNASERRCVKTSLNGRDWTACTGISTPAGRLRLAGRGQGAFAPRQYRYVVAGLSLTWQHDRIFSAVEAFSLPYYSIYDYIKISLTCAIPDVLSNKKNRLYYANKRPLRNYLHRAKYR